MKLNQLLASSVTALLIVSGAASVAADFGTAAEAEAMLERAIAAMKEDKDAALEAFNSGADGFKDRDLYVACFLQGTGEGTLTAHGGVAKLIGTSGYKLIDTKGTNLGELLDKNTKGAIETATYWFPRPGEDEPVEKESFYATIGDQNCLVGYYK